jgi:hypothetical protein
MRLKLIDRFIPISIYEYYILLQHFLPLLFFLKIDFFIIGIRIQSFPFHKISFGIVVVKFFIIFIDHIYNI